MISLRNVQVSYALGLIAAGHSPDVVAEKIGERWPEVQEKECHRSGSAEELVKAALSRLSSEISDEHREDARARLWAMSSEVYRRALAEVQFSPANKAIENMARLTGAFEPDRQSVSLEARHSLTEALAEMSEKELEEFIENEQREREV